MVEHVYRDWSRLDNIRELRGVAMRSRSAAFDCVFPDAVVDAAYVDSALRCWEYVSAQEGDACKKCGRDLSEDVDILGHDIGVCYDFMCFDCVGFVGAPKLGDLDFYGCRLPGYERIESGV